MNITEFSALVAEKMEAYLCGEMHEEISVQPLEIMKINDQSLHGISFEVRDEPAPTYYLDGMFRAFKGGMDLDAMVRDLAEAYMNNKCCGPVPAEELPDMSFKSIKHRTGLRLLGMDYNREYLKTVPYKDVGNGYALICDVQMKASDGGIFSTVVTNDMAKGQHYDMDVLFKNALETAWKNNAASLRGASEILSDDTTREGGETTYVLTTDRQLFGAAALFYPGTQAMIAHVLGEEYFAIPSSLHEFMIIRASRVQDPQILVEMVREANKIVVGPDEVLSDNVLRYSESTRELSLIPDTGCCGFEYGMPAAEPSARPACAG